MWCASRKAWMRGEEMGRPAAPVEQWEGAMAFHFGGGASPGERLVWPASR